MRRAHAILAASTGLALVAVSGGVAEARDQIRIVGSSTVFPFSTAVAEQFGNKSGFPTPVVESTGSGGGLKTAYPEVSSEIAARRIREAEATGASMLVTACPFCLQSLSAAIRATGSDIELIDLVVLVDRVSSAGGGK